MWSNFLYKLISPHYLSTEEMIRKRKLAMCFYPIWTRGVWKSFFHKGNCGTLCIFFYNRWRIWWWLTGVYYWGFSGSWIPRKVTHIPNFATISGRGDCAELGLVTTRHRSSAGRFRNAKGLRRSVWLRIAKLPLSGQVASFFGGDGYCECHKKIMKISQKIWFFHCIARVMRE